MSTIEECFEPLRNALRPKGTLDITLLRVRPGCAVESKVAQDAIDEIIRHHSYERLLGDAADAETACMKLAKILLMDSAGLA